MRAEHIADRRSSVHAAAPVVSAAILLAALVAVAIVWGGEVRAQTGALKNNPVEVVKRYLTLDSKGARLSSTTYEALTPFVDWGPDHVWGKIVIITGFTIAEDISEWEVVDNLEVVIPVTFTVLGSVYYESSGFVADPSTERIHVRVKAVRNRWRIVGPIWPPHVGHKRMINQVRQAWLDETDLAKRDQLASLQEALKKAR